MHSSRMRTTRSLIVSRHIPRMPPLCHTYLPFAMRTHPSFTTHAPPDNHACPQQPCTPPATTHAPQQPHMPQQQPCMPPPTTHAPLWTESQTPVKTLPWPNFVAGGKKLIINECYCSAGTEKHQRNSTQHTTG